MFNAVYVVGPDCLSLPILVPCLYIQQPEMPSVIDWSSQNPTQPTYPKYILSFFYGVYSVYLFHMTWVCNSMCVFCSYADVYQTGRICPRSPVA